jgi:FkbM family methyltransferase
MKFDYERADRMREKMIPYDRVLKHISLGANDTLIDVGAGSGEYAVRFARLFPEARIIALDSEEDSIKLIRKKLDGTGLKNVYIKHADICHYDLTEDITQVFFSNSFHDLECREEMMRKFSSRNALKVTLIEFKKGTMHGPPDYIRIDPSDLESMFRSAGYRLADQDEFDSHYLHVYIK